MTSDTLDLASALQDKLQLPAGHLLFMAKHCGSEVTDLMSLLAEDPSEKPRRGRPAKR